MAGAQNGAAGKALETDRIPASLDKSTHASQHLTISRQIA
jgi:hypothetical protein